MDLIITILPVVTKDLPISPRFTPCDFLSRCKFSTLTTRQPMVEFYLPTFPRFPLRKKEHKFYFGKNRTHNFRTSRCAGYLLDHLDHIYIYVPGIPDLAWVWKLSGMPLDGTVEPVLRGQILRREQWGQGKKHSPCSADHAQGSQPSG